MDFISTVTMIYLFFMQIADFNNLCPNLFFDLFYEPVYYLQEVLDKRVLNQIERDKPSPKHPFKPKE